MALCQVFLFPPSVLELQKNLILASFVSHSKPNGAQTFILTALNMMTLNITTISLLVIYFLLCRIVRLNVSGQTIMLSVVFLTAVKLNSLMVSVVLLSVIKLIVGMLIFILLFVVMINVVILRITAPTKKLFQKFCRKLNLDGFPSFLKGCRHLLYPVCINGKESANI